MESDTATEWSPTSKDCLEASMPRKFRKESYRGEGAGLNLVMCALCVISLAVSAVLTYRELGLESRIASLETRCRHQDPTWVNEILLPRMKREVQKQLRVHRTSPETNAVFRIKRDVSECNCPPGE
ncbi:hypothetical protein KM043_007113 [Ampulex compressa]|nr:hypothetical protein KM043_007113 [Ampulex compressa]